MKKTNDIKIRIVVINMNEFRKTYSKDYLDGIRKCLDDMEPFFYEKMDKIAGVILTARDNTKTIFTMGNGGSGATASHLVGDLAKGAIKPNHPRIRAIALTDNMPQILAWANDTSYENIFMEQLKNLMNPEDVVIGISGSGNSQNVIKAMEYADEHGAVTIGLTGYDGGKLKDVAQECIIVPSNNMQQIEDVHFIIGHLLMSLLRDEG
ncbi:MAG: SIS domain-containing protein [Methanomassiliicoccales archaeon]|nr:MAG: SIS domain-containing protein [Methanomassiliicoccales archaeon]